MPPRDAARDPLQANLNGQSCMDNSYDDFIAQLRVTTNNPSVQGVGIRQWTWQVRAFSPSLGLVGAGVARRSHFLSSRPRLQTCTEFAYYRAWH